MDCPTCGAVLRDVTDSWSTFVESQGAEYLATYVTIWHCDHCHTSVGAEDNGVDWVLRPEEAVEVE